MPFQWEKNMEKPDLFFVALCRIYSPNLDGFFHDSTGMGFLGQLDPMGDGSSAAQGSQVLRLVLQFAFGRGFPWVRRSILGMCGLRKGDAEFEKKDLREEFISTASPSRTIQSKMMKSLIKSCQTQDILKFREVSTTFSLSGAPIKHCPGINFVGFF